jgi:hypothetical protein
VFNRGVFTWWNYIVALLLFLSFFNRRWYPSVFLYIHPESK